MSKDIYISAVERTEKDRYIGLYVMALIELARRLVREEAEAKTADEQREAS